MIDQSLKANILRTSSCRLMIEIILILAPKSRIAYLIFEIVYVSRVHVTCISSPTLDKAHTLPYLVTHSNLMTNSC